MHLIQVGDDLTDRLSAPGIKEFFVIITVPLGESIFPRDVMEGHGVDHGPVAVEEIGAEVTGREFKLHREETPCCE